VKSREEFEARAIRDAEKAIYAPPGWWGGWRDVHGPSGERVRFTGSAWVFSVEGTTVSRHDSRAFAIGKARKHAAAKLTQAST
jgi:hypothetical protein